MDVKTISRAYRPRPVSALGRRQSGDILLVSLVFLLICLLGVLTAMRSGLVDTFMAGNTLTRQKNVQVADIALRSIETQMQTAAGAGPLQIYSSSQPWYRDSPGASAPSAAYWDSCLGNSSPSARCASVPLTVGTTTVPGYTALVAVQFTGAMDQINCDTNTSATQPPVATYFDIFVHVKETNGVTVANTETLYRLCP